MNSPSLKEVGAPVHSATNARLFLTRNGSVQYPRWWNNLDFTATVEYAKHKPAGAGVEYNIPGVHRVTGTLTGGHTSPDVLKAFRESMHIWCNLPMEFTIEAELCYPDGEGKTALLIIKNAILPSLSLSVPVHDLLSESVPFEAQDYEIIDGLGFAPLTE